MSEIVNGVIERVTLSNDDHGLLSAWVHLDYSGSGQAFGGYALYLPKHPEKDVAGILGGNWMRVLHEVLPA